MKNTLKKNIALKMLACAALLAPGTFAGAAGFGDDLVKFSPAEGTFSAAQPKDAADPDDLITLDLAVKVPFKVIKNAAVKVAASEPRMTIIDPSAQVLSRSGEFLKISNISVNAGGIIVNPTLTLRPYLEGVDKLAIRIERVQMHASMEPGEKAAQEFSQEQMMADIMKVLIDGITKALDKKFAASKPPMKGSDVVTLTYDKATWTLHGAISTKFLKAYVPPGMIGQVHLTKFSFNDSAFSIRLQTK